MLLKPSVRRKLYWSVAGVIALSVALILIADFRINKATSDKVYNKVTDIPYHRVGLLLGTSKYLDSGRPNLYFKYRIDAAVELYKAHKVDFFVISGDNSKKDYNEPEDMKNELIKQSVPPEKIYLDYAGFRTYDSVIRLDKIFGQQSFTIISQEFHNRRAIYIATSLGLESTGYNARDVDKYNGFKTKLREKLARVKVFLDLVFGKEPKFLGERVEVL